MVAKVGELRAGREPDGMGYSALDAPEPAADGDGGDGVGTLQLVCDGSRSPKILWVSS